MIIKRSSGIIKGLYYLSSLPSLNGTILQPSIPNTELVKEGLEDKKVRRISLFKTIGHALQAREHIVEGDVLSVYKAGRVQWGDVLIPSITQSPKSIITEEVWSMSPVILEKVGEIKVTKKIKEEKVPMGPRGIKRNIETWDWEEIKPKWKK